MDWSSTRMIWSVSWATWSADQAACASASDQPFRSRDTPSVDSSRAARRTATSASGVSQRGTTTVSPLRVGRSETGLNSTLVSTSSTGNPAPWSTACTARTLASSVAKGRALWGAAGIS